MTITSTRSHSNVRGIRQAKQRFRALRPIGLALLLAVSVAFATSRAKADTTLHILLYENGILVDETASCSYMSSHVIWIPSQQVLGSTTTANPMTIYDANNQIIGYLSQEEDPIGP